jgi:homoaconitase/3-isopropylmalate dehydratase large subunit
MNFLDTPNVIKQVKVTEETSIYMQRLTYEMECYKSIVTTIITSTGEFTYNKKLYEYHMKKVREINIEHRLAMNELLNEYGKEFANRTDISTSLDFNSNILQFIVNQGGHTSCQIGK